MKQVAADPLLNCKANVLLEYSITNIDVDKNTVLDIQISLNKVRPFASVIEDVPLQDRTILTGNTLTFSKSKYLDFCSTYEESGKDGLTFDVVVDCIGGRTFVSTVKYAFDEIPPPTCNADLQISCKASDDGPCHPRSNSHECTFRPHYFDFMLSGGLCASSKNDQDPSKFVCVDEGDMSEYAELFVVVEGIKTKDNYFAGFVSMGEVFTVGRGAKVDSDMKVYIFSQLGGIPIQTFRFHTSCSKNLSTGDVFGGIEIAGFRDDLRIVTHLPSAVAPIYYLSYEITNKGVNAVFLQHLIFHYNDYAGISVVPKDSIIGSKDILSGITPGFNVTSDVFEVTATLDYGTLPGFNSRDCVASAKFVASSCSFKHPKSKGSKSSRTNSCSGKGSKGSTKSQSSKRSKSNRGKGAKSLNHPSQGGKGRTSGKGKYPKSAKYPNLSTPSGKGRNGPVKKITGDSPTKGKRPKSSKSPNPPHTGRKKRKRSKGSTHFKGKGLMVERAKVENGTRNMISNE